MFFIYCLLSSFLFIHLFLCIEFIYLFIIEFIFQGVMDSRRDPIKVLHQELSNLHPSKVKDQFLLTINLFSAALDGLEIGFSGSKSIFHATYRK